MLPVITTCYHKLPQFIRVNHGIHFLLQFSMVNSYHNLPQPIQFTTTYDMEKLSSRDFQNFVSVKSSLSMFSTMLASEIYSFALSKSQPL